MTRSEEIKSIITVKLQAIQIIHETAHERIMANAEDIKKLTAELVEIEHGSRPDTQISL